MANQFLNAQEYANTMLLLLKNQLVWGRLVDGQFKDQVTDQNGLTINVKRPPRFVATSGAALQAQDLVTGTAPVTVDQYKNVHISVGDLEYATSYNALMQNETMKSAASTLAHDVDKFVASKTLAFNSWVAGTASTTASGNAVDPTKNIASSSQAMGAHTRLMAAGAPNADIMGVMSFHDAEQVRGSLLSSFTPGINETALEKVKVPLISEVDWYASQQLPTLTCGTRTATGAAQVDTGGAHAGTQTVNYRSVKGSAGTAGMTQIIDLKGLSNNNTIELGAVFTIAGCYAWDWRNQTALPDLQQFTVVGDSTGAALGTTVGGAATTATVTISPPIIVQGTTDGTNTYANSAFGTVDAAPANGAAVSWVGAASATCKVKSAFNKRAISLVSARLQMPFTGVASFASDPDTGIAIRYWRGSDISTGAHVHRWDMIYGAAVMDPALGTRICGT